MDFSEKVTRALVWWALETSLHQGNFRSRQNGGSIHHAHFGINICKGDRAGLEMLFQWVFLFEKYQILLFESFYLENKERKEKGICNQ